MTKRILLLFVMVQLVLSFKIQAGIVIDLLSDPEKYVILKNPYVHNQSYAFVYVRANVNARQVHSLNKEVQVTPSTKEPLEIYLKGVLIYTFSAEASGTLISIIKKGWVHPERPSCPLVMLYIQHSLLTFNSPVLMVDTGASLLQDAVTNELIQPGDVIVIESEQNGFKHSGGLIYLNQGYFLSCENGAKGFFFRYASHIDSERHAFGHSTRIYRVIKRRTSDSINSGYSCPSHDTAGRNLSEAVLRYKAEVEKISHLSPPSYIK